MTERIEPIHPGEIIRGKRSITVDTAFRFSNFFGTSPELYKIHTFEFDDSQILQIV